jgi:hypothetical protein
MATKRKRKVGYIFCFEKLDVFYRGFPWSLQFVMESLEEICEVDVVKRRFFQLEFFNFVETDQNPDLENSQDPETDWTLRIRFQEYPV